jgi:hypothetical protein
VLDLVLDTVFSSLVLLSLGSEPVAGFGAFTSAGGWLEQKDPRDAKFGGKDGSGLPDEWNGNSG